MTTTIMRLQQRSDSTADWEAADPILLDGEMGYDSTAKRVKIGDGESTWTELPYWNLTLDDISPAVADAITEPGPAQDALLASFAGKQGGSVPLASFITGTVDVTGATNYTTQVNTALAALDALGGGELLLPSGTVKCTGQIVLPKGNRNTNGMWRMNPITIRGTTTHAAGQRNRGTGGSRLLLTYAGSGASEDAAIVSQGEGVLTFKDIILQDTTAGSDTPFLYTTGTTVKVDASVAVIGPGTLASPSTNKKDFWVAGGTAKFYPSAPVTADPSNYGTMDAPFQGYGSTVVGAYFNGVRRVVYGRSYANQIVIAYNFFDKDCGSNLAGGACIEFDASLTNVHPGDPCAGNVILGNYFENNGYVYGVKLIGGAFTYIAGNGFEDSGASFKACVRLEGHVISTVEYASLANHIAGNLTAGYPLVSSDYMSARPSSGNMVLASTNEGSILPVRTLFYGDSYTVGLSGRAVMGLSPGGHAGYVLSKDPSATGYPRVALATRPAARFTDGVSTNGSAVFESAAANFVPLDQGLPIAGTGIPSGTVIAEVVDDDTIVMSNKATATGTGVTFTFGRLGAEVQQIEFDRGHFVPQGSAPTVAVGVAAGTGGSVGATISGKDAGGSITVTCGASGTSTGKLAGVSHALAHYDAQRVVVSPANAAAAAVGCWADRADSSSWDLYCITAPSAGAVLKFNFLVMQTG